MRNNRTHRTNYRKLWRAADDQHVLGKREDWKKTADSGQGVAVLDAPDTTIDYRQAWQQDVPQQPVAITSGITIGGCLEEMTFDRADFTRKVKGVGVNIF